MYWCFVVMVNILFASIIISQLTSTFHKCRAEADLAIVLAKCTIMKDIDDILLPFKRCKEYKVIFG